MTEVFVEVGPVTVCGPNGVGREYGTAAVECIDDDMGWLDDHPVAATQLWRDAMRETIGERVDSVVLVCPTWWPAAWLDVVRDAGLTVATTVVVMSRAQVLADVSVTVVELAPELVVISQTGGTTAISRRGDVDADARAVAEKIPLSATLLVDIPEGVDGGIRLVETVSNLLQAKGCEVTIGHRDHVARAVAALSAAQVEVPYRADTRPPRFGRRGTAVLTGTLLSVAAVCGGFAIHRHEPAAAAGELPMTLLVEGRIGVMVPAQWRVQRVTSGPGSARVQVVSPAEGDVVLHITQSPLAVQQTMQVVAESLRNALSEQPAGVFVDFDPAARRADKPAVTYREIRPDRDITWTVLVDKTVRIAIGCQSGPGREQLVRDACDRAVGSAHAVF